MVMEIRQDSVETYIVRIYRREPDQSLIGIVELPLGDQHVPFLSFAELQAILMQPPRTASSTSGGRHDPDTL